MTICAKCKTAKHGTDFTKSQTWCKSCVKEYNASYYAANKENRAESYKENREERLIVQAQYRAIHKFEEEFKQKARATSKEWYKNNLGRVKEKNARRRALILNSTVNEVNYDKILERDGYVCYMCGTEVEFRRESYIYQSNELHFEHVIDLALGGEHSMNNIKVSCGNCNLTK